MKNRYYSLLLSAQFSYGTPYSEVELNCRILPSMEVDAVSSKEGVVESIFVSLGDIVTKGDNLITLEPTVELAMVNLKKLASEFTTGIRIRELADSFAQRNLERVSVLFENGLVSLSNG